jgi:hypothetical protein
LESKLPKDWKIAGNNDTVMAIMVAHTKRGNFVMAHKKHTMDQPLAGSELEYWPDVVYDS